ncbi:NAD(P)/FAD-dependent oxidoreductase [Campylobacter suis]|uniref:NADH:ubiquinone reductase (non-electrogenic) n=1 Tax=Campylobacter suis TaxID=2790657 RepID=A0ABM8Q2H4_9BACT|nr:FAD-dependent oxidoreductase [Campylobacter suis]CAD7287048.1 NADH dehydrogenase-like protein [Campylobacter suis]
MRPNIVVIGAGYAGVSFLKSLDEACFRLANFTIINKNSYHYHSTMLHKVATAEKSGKIMFDLREFLHPEIKIVQQVVIDIDEASHMVVTEFGEFRYDYLVVAAGFEKESFNLKGIENAMFIDSYIQSGKIAERLKLKFDEGLESKNGLKVAVCGGGLTGIEFAASCADMLRKKCEFYGVSNEMASKFSVHLISSTPRLLTFFSEKLSQKTADKLTEKGVKILHSTRIDSLQDGKVVFQNGNTLDADIIIWSAGVKGASIVSDSDVENERGRVKVDDTLKAIGSKHRYYIGDVSAVSDGKGGFYPPTAQIACEQGEFLARHFKAMLFGEKTDEKFRFKSNGMICSIGHSYATAQVLGVELGGWVPAFLKTMVEKKWNAKLLGFGEMFL